jgi:hypothetical protein
MDPVEIVSPAEMRRGLTGRAYRINTKTILARDDERRARRCAEIQASACVLLAPTSRASTTAIPVCLPGRPSRVQQSVSLSP